MTDYYLARGEAPSVFITTNQLDDMPADAFSIGDNCLRATPASVWHIARARQARRDIATRKAAERRALHARKGWRP